MLMWCSHGTGPIPCVIVKLATLFPLAVLYHVKRWSYWTCWTASEAASSTRCFMNLSRHHGLVHATSKMTPSAQYGAERSQQVCHSSTQRLQSKSSKQTATSRSHAGVGSKHYFVHATKSHCCVFFFRGFRWTSTGRSNIAMGFTERTHLGKIAWLTSFRVLHVRLHRLRSSSAPGRVHKHDDFRGRLLCKLGRSETTSRSFQVQRASGPRLAFARKDIMG